MTLAPPAWLKPSETNRALSILYVTSRYLKNQLCRVKLARNVGHWRHLKKKKTHSSENSKSLAGKSRARIQVYAAHAYGSREAKQSAQDTERAWQNQDRHIQARKFEVYNVQYIEILKVFLIWPSV